MAPCIQQSKTTCCARPWSGFHLKIPCAPSPELLLSANAAARLPEAVPGGVPLSRSSPVPGTGASLLPRAATPGRMRRAPSPENASACARIVICGRHKAQQVLHVGKYDHTNIAAEGASADSRLRPLSPKLYRNLVHLLLLPSDGRRVRTRRTAIRTRQLLSCYAIPTIAC